MSKIFFDLTPKYEIQIEQVLNTHEFCVLDLSLVSASSMMKEYPQLVAGVSTIMSKNKKCEIIFNDFHHPVNEADILAQLQGHGFTGIANRLKTKTFVTSRVLSMIVNEAYSLMSAGGVERMDLDLAMKYGVNYPLGPMEWSQGEEEKLKKLLAYLSQTYQNNRYLSFL